MTIEDFRKLKNGDKVIVWNGIYTVSVGWNHYRVTFTEFLMNNKSVYRIYDKASLVSFSVYENGSNFGENIAYGHFKFVNDMEHYDEKKYLESQLKEAEEQVQKETARVDSIKAKIEELTKPKLKIGGLYKFEKFGNDFIGVVVNADRNSGWYGVLNHRLNGIITYNIEHYKVTEITNPKYSHIGKTIMEFHNLKFGNT